MLPIDIKECQAFLIWLTNLLLSPLRSLQVKGFLFSLPPRLLCNNFLPSKPETNIRKNFLPSRQRGKFPCKRAWLLKGLTEATFPSITIKPIHRHSRIRLDGPLPIQTLMILPRIYQKILLEFSRQNVRF